MQIVVSEVYCSIQWILNLFIGLGKAFDIKKFFKNVSNLKLWGLRVIHIMYYIADWNSQ